jgi:hypothetical protein
VTVSFVSPPPLLVQLPVLETASIVNRGPSLTGLKVRVAFGAKRQGVGSTGFENSVLQRWNPATASWAQLATSADSNGVLRGSFSSNLPAGASSLRLRITVGVGFMPQQDGNEAPLAISLTRGTTVVAEQELTLPVLGPSVVVASQPTTMPRSGQAEFDFVIQNSTGGTYPAFAASLNIVCQTATIICNAASGKDLAGFMVDWFDGSGWQPLAVGHGPNGETLVESGTLPPGSQTVRIRLSFGSDLDPRARAANLQLWLSLPDFSVAWATAKPVSITS